MCVTVYSLECTVAFVTKTLRRASRVPYDYCFVILYVLS